MESSVAAAKAISTYEVAAWRKLHPTADLALTFNDPAVTPEIANRIRTQLGFKNPVPVLDAFVLTLVFDSSQRLTPKRLSIEAYVFLGSFPRGFRARYIVRTDLKEPKVLTRTILQRYEIAAPAPAKTSGPDPK